MKYASLMIAAAVVSFGALAAAPASAAPKAAARSCFRLTDLGAHTVGDNHTLFLNVGPKDVYKVTMRNTCLGGVQSTDPIEIHAVGGSASICEAGELDVRTTLAGGGGLPARCLIDDLAKLPPAEAAARRKAK